ncbi:MAG: AraC family transcriptional regulator [Myxococcota bacterium]
MEPPPFSFVARRPDPPLRGHVDLLWHAQGQIGYTRDHIVPTGHVVLLVNLGAPIRTVDAKGDDTTQRRAWVCGLQTRAMLNEPLHGTHVLGVSFRPHGAHAVLGVPLAEIADRVVALDDLWGAAARQLRERIGDRTLIEARLRTAEAWLTERLAGYEAEPARARVFERAMNGLCGVPPRSIRELCAEVGVSHKHFIDRCRRFVGVPPQQVIRIRRLLRTLEAIDPQRPVDWATLAASGGYCDQSHLVREFGRLATMTPRQYLQRRRAVFGPELQAGQDPCFVPIVEPR